MTVSLAIAIQRRSADVALAPLGHRIRLADVMQPLDASLMSCSRSTRTDSISSVMRDSERGM